MLPVLTSPDTRLPNVHHCRTLVKQMLCKDPATRLTAGDVVTHPWVLGEDVPVRPLPATHERLSAFIKARHAFYGSLLLGLLAHHLSSSASAEGMGADKETEFDAFQVRDRDKCCEPLKVILFLLQFCRCSGCSRWVGSCLTVMARATSMRTICGASAWTWATR